MKVTSWVAPDLKFAKHRDKFLIRCLQYSVDESSDVARLRISDGQREGHTGGDCFLADFLTFIVVPQLRASE